MTMYEEEVHVNSHAAQATYEAEHIEDAERSRMTASGHGVSDSFRGAHQPQSAEGPAFCSGQRATSFSASSNNKQHGSKY